MADTELLRIGLDLEKTKLPAIDRESMLYQEIFGQVQAEYDRVSLLWFGRMKDIAQTLNVTEQLATTVWFAETVLNMSEHPTFKFMYGFLMGLFNYRGYCWEDESGKVHIGLDEGWFESLIESYAHAAPSPKIATKIIDITIAEEVFHAFMRQYHPELAEENISANNSVDTSEYWDSWGEKAAKEFAFWLVNQMAATDLA